MLLCVSLVWPTKFANALSFYAKQILMLENLWKMVENLHFGKIGVKTLFLIDISLHTHVFCSSISMLWGASKMCLCYFQKTMFFPKTFVSLCLFRLIQSVFRSIEIVLKLFREASICFDWSKPILDKSKLFWNFLKIFKEVSVCFNQSKLIFDQSKIVNQVF